MVTHVVILSVGYEIPGSRVSYYTVERASANSPLVGITRLRIYSTLVT